VCVCVCDVTLIGILSSYAEEELRLKRGIIKIINKLSRSCITQVVGWLTEEL
jgi:hypothetical protein